VLDKNKKSSNDKDDEINSLASSIVKFFDEHLILRQLDLAPALGEISSLCFSSKSKKAF